MAKQEVLIIADYAEESFLTLDELAEICGVNRELLDEFITYEIIHPLEHAKEQRVFALSQLHRIQKALRLQHDFEVNLAGAALALDLLEELELLRAQRKLLERYFMKL